MEQEKLHQGEESPDYSSVYFSLLFQLVQDSFKHILPSLHTVMIFTLIFHSIFASHSHLTLSRIYGSCHCMPFVMYYTSKPKIFVLTHYCTPESQEWKDPQRLCLTLLYHWQEVDTLRGEKSSSEGVSSNTYTWTYISWLPIQHSYYIFPHLPQILGGQNGQAVITAFSTLNFLLF